MMSILLFVVALILLAVFGAVGTILTFTVGIFALPYNIINDRKLLWKRFSTYFLELAISIDIVGNVLLSPIWNTSFLKESHPDYNFIFGESTDTISGVLGINEKEENLTQIGVIMCAILNWIDPGHTRVAAINFEKRRPRKWVRM